MVAAAVWALVSCLSFDSDSRSRKYSTDFFVGARICIQITGTSHRVSSLVWQIPASRSSFLSTAMAMGCRGSGRFGVRWCCWQQSKWEAGFLLAVWKICRSGFGFMGTGIPWGGWRNSTDDFLLLRTTLWLHKTIIHWSVFPIWSCHGSLHAV